MMVLSDGSFVLEWRTFRWCGTAPPPCDQQANNLITDGGRAQGSMAPIGGDSAAGSVSASNDPAMVPKGNFVADVSVYQVLTLDLASQTIRLCGPDFTTLAPVAVVDAMPCG